MVVSDLHLHNFSKILQMECSSRHSWMMHQSLFMTRVLFKFRNLVLAIRVLLDRMACKWTHMTTRGHRQTI